MRTIDITPTRDEEARILAWALGNVGSTVMVLKDYWAPTEDEHVRIRGAYALFDSFIKLAREADMNATPAEKRKWARAALKKHGFSI